MTPTASRPTSAGARFVAYEPAERIGNPEDGTSMPLRAETYVQEFSSIKVAQLEEKLDSDFPTVSVTFDAKSANMNHNFSANAAAATPLADRLIQAYKSGTPLYVAIETSRRKKNSETKKAIPRYTSIHELRGGTVDSAKGNPLITLQNCIKVIVAVGAVNDASDTVFAPAREIRSDVTEWQQLRQSGNLLGDIAPAGWRCIMRDGKRVGGITEHQPENLPAVRQDAAELVDAVVKALNQNGIGGAAPRVAAANHTGVRRVHAVEDQPWKPVNSDGRPNAGSWHSTHYRVVQSTAVALYRAAVGVPEGEPRPLEDAASDRVWRLVKLLMYIADKVQEQVLRAPSCRAARSYSEAWEWAKQAIEQQHPYTSGYLDDKAAEWAWAKRVFAAAARDFEVAYKEQADHLGLDLATVVDAQNAPAPQQLPAAVQQPNQAMSGDVVVTDMPEPASVAAPEPVMADTDPDAERMWKSLAASINMGGAHIFKLSPVLAATFCVPNGVLAEIPADDFKAQVIAWQQDTESFTKAAKTAYAEANAQPQRRAG